MPRKSAAKKGLLDGSDEEKEPETLRVNDAFAKRFQHNKEREELHRLQAKLGPHAAARAVQRTGRGGDPDAGEAEDSEEASSSSDEEEEEAVPAVDERFLETLLKIRRRDPSIYAPTATAAAPEAAPAATEAPEKGRKKVTLREVQARQLLAGGSDDEEAGVGELGAPLGPSYAAEQAELRAAFLEAAAAAAEEGDGLVAPKRTGQAAPLPVDGGRRAELLESLFTAPPPGADGDAAADAFLRDYLEHQRWRQPAEAPVGGDVSASEEELERVELFEQQYNFRFEEPGGAVLASQPRKPEGTIRKEGTARADARRAKAERLAEAKAQVTAEVKRLKALKRREIEAKLAQIAAVAGGRLALAEGALDEEWDEDRHEAAMAAAFGDEYYADGEEAEDAKGKPPGLDGLDDELAALLAEEAVDGAAGFAAAAARAAQRVASDEEGDDEDAAGAAAEPADEEGNKFGKRAMKRWRRAVAAALEEYHALDREDTVAGLPCRFKYRQVAPDKYGLRTAEVLALSDKELNQVVALKKLAPYREEEAKPRYGSKRERAAAALQRTAEAEAAAGAAARAAKRQRREGGEEAAEAAAAAARVRSFVAPTRKARREAAEAPAPQAPAFASKNAAKHAKRRAKREAAAGGTGAE